MSSDYARRYPSKAKVKALWRSAMSALDYGALLLDTVGNGSRPEPSPVECSHLTLLIPGLFGTRGVMQPFETYLRFHGFQPRTVNLGLRSARALKEARSYVEYRLQRIRSRSPFIERIDIIGHSMGALVGLDLLGRGSLHNVDVRLVALGAPFRGTSAAYFLSPFSGAAAELTPTCRSGPRPIPPFTINREKFLSIAGELDTVVPAHSSWHGLAINETLPVDHAGLVLDERVHRHVAEFLKP